MVALAAAVAAMAVGTAAQADVRPLKTGFFDDIFLTESAGRWIERSVEAGGSMVRIPVSWRTVAPGRRPAGFDASDPASEGYAWETVDRAVDEASERGVEILLSLGHAPDWAEGENPPDDVLDGAWRPDPVELRAFAAATARRYGSRVGAWQIWNEPNLQSYLAPQVERRDGRKVLVGADLYRRLLNAAGKGIRSVLPDALIVTGGTAPFGDYPVIRRTPPVRFLRKLLCLDRRLRATKCDDPATFDVLSHHPYSIGEPGRSALNPDDASVPNLGRLTRLLRAAERRGTVEPSTRKRLWITEFSYDSSPPDPEGVPDRQRARWIADAYERFWRQGVEAVLWYRVADQPGPDFAATYQSGAFLESGAPKRASLRSFVLPFVARRAGRGRTRYWGRSASGGTVELQARAGGGWRTLRTLRVRAGVPFVGTIRRSGRVTYRAAGTVVSVSWRVG